MLMVLAVLFPIIGGLVLLSTRCRSRRARERAVLGVAGGTAALALLAVFAAPHNQTVLVRFTTQLTISFRVDGLGAVFAVMVSVLWVIASVYALEYMKHEGAETRFFSFFLVSFGVTLGIAFAANIVTMYLFYELLTLATLPLVMHAMDNRARYAGKQYIIYSMTGAGLGFISMIYLITGGQSADFVMGGMMAPGTQATNMLQIMFLLGFLGFGAKAAVFPFHRWLIAASVAPTPVTALLHAVAVVKAGVFALMRLIYYCYGAQVLSGTWSQLAAGCLVAFTIVYASFMALRNPHLKRRLAYSTVANLSYILVGAVMMSPEGLVAAVLHMLSHAVNKITLFFCAGAILYRTGKEYVYELRGYGRGVMPLTMFCFTVTGVSLMGLPPTAGFISKWWLGTAAASSGRLVGLLGTGALILASILAVLYIMTVVFYAYFPFRSTQPEEPEKNMDPNWMMKGPLLILSALSIAGIAASGPLSRLLSTILFS